MQEESFALWNAWSSIYADESPSRNLLNQIRDTYWLVSLVDNDYVRGDIGKFFQEVLSCPPCDLKNVLHENEMRARRKDSFDTLPSAEIFRVNSKLHNLSLAH